ncbi:MAG: hypothetical protein II477_05805 [Lachnospiraceae bacterium]|nr:hypothetical protein [Lachnospiraceae bacterium]MBQ3906760.1 hypothetical protein [Lachnospiraceae bacterium]MCR4599402.1 hypothetical protein [Acetatifactor sp.]
MDMNNSGFPTNEIEALALLYLQHQSLSGLAPEEIYDKFADAMKRIAKQKEESQKESDGSY